MPVHYCITLRLDNCIIISPLIVILLHRWREFWFCFFCIFGFVGVYNGFLMFWCLSPCVNKLWVIALGIYPWGLTISGKGSQIRREDTSRLFAGARPVIYLTVLFFVSPQNQAKLFKYQQKTPKNHCHDLKNCYGEINMSNVWLSTGRKLKKPL